MENLSIFIKSLQNVQIIFPESFFEMTVEVFHEFSTPKINVQSVHEPISMTEY